MIGLDEIEAAFAEGRESGELSYEERLAALGLEPVAIATLAGRAAEGRLAANVPYRAAVESVFMLAIEIGVVLGRAHPVGPQLDAAAVIDRVQRMAAEYEDGFDLPDDEEAREEALSEMDGERYGRFYGGAEAFAAVLDVLQILAHGGEPEQGKWPRVSTTSPATMFTTAIEAELAEHALDQSQEYAIRRANLTAELDRRRDAERAS